MMAAATLAPSRVRVRVVSERALTLMLRGGRFYQGGRWNTADVGIDDSGLLRFGPGLAARETIEVTGKVVAPGFIDILADNGANLARTTPVFEKYKLTDGVTTALQMHGGSPDCAGYYAQAARFPHAINYGVSTFVMGIRYRIRDTQERLRAVERNLDCGALGVSHSIEYQPAPYAELLAYAKLARRYDRPFVLHLRYSSTEQELEGVDEGLRLARESGARLHIAHLHSTGGTFHMEAALEKVRAAIRSGVVVTVCVYPYSYWATYLSSRRFDPGWRERYQLDYPDLRVVGTGERLTEASFARHRKLRTLVAVPEGTMPFARTFDLAIREDFCMIGSDGGIAREPRSNSHPRGAACFATAVRYALDHSIPLERIIAKMTELPRALVREPLKDRGALEEGLRADLCVFDPAAIRGKATVENPNQFSDGISLVTVNGGLSYRAGRLGTQSGKAIRFG
jgi:N-acyl-D-aspartate/D-glutamate deacylase